MVSSWLDICPPGPNFFCSINFPHFKENNFLSSALAKNACNQTGTGVGKGEKLTESQQTVLNMLETNNSDIVSEIESGFESTFDLVIVHILVAIYFN